MDNKLFLEKTIIKHYFKGYSILRISKKFSIPFNDIVTMIHKYLAEPIRKG